MDIDIMIKKCLEMPEFSLKNNLNNIELFMNHSKGKGVMKFYSLFPGIYLAYIFINSPTLPAPDLSEETSFNTYPLLLNYCVSGRCELLLDDDSFIYLKDDEFSISKRSAQKEFSYPLRIYEGIEYFIDLDALCKNASYINDEFDINISEIISIYCSQNQTYISKCHDAVKEILLKIWKLHYENNSDSLFLMKIYTLQLLKRLLKSKYRLPQKSNIYFTATQVEIAQKVEEIITSDLKIHHPVRELSQKFSVSETSIKNYFRGVYGKNISVYLRETRMNAAAKLLEDTQLSISKISEQVGYINQGKFASVFKSQFQMTPLEYRRNKKLKHI